MSFKVLVIDNYDSFVYNLVQYLGELKAEPIVKRNDAITIEEAEKIAPDSLLISPGPGNPEQAGISIELIKWAAGKIPILGICLGHQCIGEAWGGKTIHGRQIMHGKTFPEDLEITATTDDVLIMFLKHKEFEIYGLQFHPESILTSHGHKLIENFLSCINKNH